MLWFFTEKNQLKQPVGKTTNNYSNKAATVAIFCADKFCAKNMVAFD